MTSGAADFEGYLAAIRARGGTAKGGAFLPLLEAARQGNREAEERVVASLLHSAAETAQRIVGKGDALPDAVHEANLIVVGLVQDKDVADPRLVLDEAVSDRLACCGF